MKEFMWKSMKWIVKRHGEVIQFKSAISTRWRTVAVQVDNPSLNLTFRQLLANAASELAVYHYDPLQAMLEDLQEAA